MKFFFLETFLWKKVTLKNTSPPENKMSDLRYSGHKNLKKYPNLYLFRHYLVIFKKGEDFSKFCGLLTIS